MMKMLIKCQLTQKIYFIIIICFSCWALLISLFSSYTTVLLLTYKIHILKCFKSILVQVMDIFCFALPAKKMNNATVFNKSFIPPGAINWWILDVRVTAVLRDSRLGLSPFLLLSGEGSRWLILELVTVVLLWQIVNDWVWLVLFGGPFCELDNTPNFWLRNVKFWT